jgi:hypothetical protein
MNATARRLSLIVPLAAMLLIVVIWHTHAVTCVNPDNNGAASAWAQGASIAVTVSGFSAALQPCVKTAFDNWNAAKSINNSKVTFTVAFGTAISTTGKNGVYQVTSETPKDANGNATTQAGVTGGQTNGTNRINANTSVNPQTTNCTATTETVAHEIGHTFGLGECTHCTAAQQSVMIGLPCGQRDLAGNCVAPAYNDTTVGLPGPTSCDNTTISTKNYPPQTIPGCQTDCPSGSRTCIPCGSSPILLDISGNGFHLTGAANGVLFDISGTGNPIEMGWTVSGSDSAFLALPGADGLVHSGKQLFGNFTPQPPSNQPNGFIALAVYDDPANGGNGDGTIDARDDVFLRLRLWVDANHDGVSQPSELYTLPSLGVYSISLSYKESRRTDQYGNQFRYRAPVNGAESQDLGQTAYDVFFVTLGPIAKNNGCIVPKAGIMPARAGGR